ncbi:MAG: hypothetical protein ACR2KV_14990 [Solirubrobacteraceae bacterium]
MREIFNGFLLQRFVGLIALLVVLAVVLGIRSLATGSVVAGLALLAGALVILAAVGSLLLRRFLDRRR